MGCYYSPKQAFCPEIVLILSLSLPFHNITSLLLLMSSQTPSASPCIWDPGRLPGGGPVPAKSMLQPSCRFISPHNRALQPLHHFYCLFSSKFLPKSSGNATCEDAKENSPAKKHALVSKGDISVQVRLIGLTADKIVAGWSVCDTYGFLLQAWVFSSLLACFPALPGCSLSI